MLRRQVSGDLTHAVLVAKRDDPPEKAAAKSPMHCMEDQSGHRQLRSDRQANPTDAAKHAAGTTYFKVVLSHPQAASSEICVDIRQLYAIISMHEAVQDEGRKSNV